VTRAWPLLAVVLLLALAQRPVAAQCLPPLIPPDQAPPCTESYPSWTGELAALGANAVLGGVSAGVMQRLHGGSFSDGFLRGLAGGAVIYGGKRVAVERFGGAGLVGRQVAAVGGSMIRNAGEGRGTLEQIVLPVGPVRLYVQGAAPRVRVRADAFTIGWLLYSLYEPELRLDAGKSLSAGVPVFLTSDRIIVEGGDTAHAGGLAVPGIIMLADVAAFGRDFARRTFEHERIHALQMDQVFLTITDPVEDQVLSRIPGLRRLEPWLDINLSAQFMSLVNSGIPKHLNRPWETEAIFFSR
jgi:hypothetical protein